MALRWLGSERQLLSAPRCPGHLWHCRPVPRGRTAHPAAMPDERTHRTGRLPGHGHGLGPGRRLMATTGPRHVTAAPGKKDSVLPASSENWEPSALDSPAQCHFPELTDSRARRVPGEYRGQGGRPRREGDFWARLPWAWPRKSPRRPALPEQGLLWPLLPVPGGSGGPVLPVGRSCSGSPTRASGPATRTAGQSRGAAAARGGAGAAGAAQGHRPLNRAGTGRSWP